MPLNTKPLPKAAEGYSIGKRGSFNRGTNPAKVTTRSKEFGAVIVPEPKQLKREYPRFASRTPIKPSAIPN